MERERQDKGAAIMNKAVMAVWKIFSGTCPVVASKIMFYRTNHKRLDLKNPVMFDEKLQYLKLFKYSKDNKVSFCADKFAVRQYVAERKCKDALNELIFPTAYKSIEEVPWNRLPDKFVIKCTHGCQMNIICTNKLEFDLGKAKSQLNKWLKEKQWKMQAELHYKKIYPRIIIEKYIPFSGTGGGDLPIDYKIYCFNGKPQIILVCSEREKKVKYSYYDLAWNRLNNIVKPEMNNKEDISPPKSLGQMLNYSKCLASGGDFPFVRIDFYDLNGKAIFGEMTFTPSGCNDDDYSLEGQNYLGKLLDIGD